MCTLGEFIWDFCGRHWGKGADRGLLVLFCAEEPRLAVLDASSFEHSQAPMPQQIPMSERPRTCRTVRTPWAPVGLGVVHWDAQNPALFYLVATSAWWH